MGIYQVSPEVHVPQVGNHCFKSCNDDDDWCVHPFVPLFFLANVRGKLKLIAFSLMRAYQHSQGYPVRSAGQEKLYSMTVA